MANKYTDTITEVLYGTMESLQAEPVGILQSVQRNVSDVTKASFGKEIESLVTGDVTINSASSFTPQMGDIDGPEDSDGNDTFKLTNHIFFDVSILPEQQRHANNTIGWKTQLNRRLLKGLRAGRNTIEGHLAAAMYQSASRAIGTAGTTPFASNADLIEDGMKIMVDSGINRYQGDISACLNSAAGTKMRKLTGLQKVNEAGTADLLRRGSLGSLFGCDIRESSQIASHTKGDADGYLVDLAEDYAVGSKTIHVDTGTGAILAGDVVKFGSDTTEYVVVTGFAGDGDGDIVLGGDGLVNAVADGAAVTISDSFTANLMYTSSAAEFASRTPDLGQDKAIFRSDIKDDLADLNWCYSIYPGRGMQVLRVEMFAGYKVWNQRELLILKG